MIHVTRGYPLFLCRNMMQFKLDDSPISISCPGSTVRHEYRSDVFRIEYPDVTKDYTLTASSSGFLASTTVRYGPIIGARSCGRVLCVGDSTVLGTGDAGGWVKYAGTELGAAVTMVGSILSGGFQQEGWGGYTFLNFTTGDAGPFRNGGNWDLGTYETSIGGAPDHVIISLGINDITNAIGGAVAPATMATASVVQANALLAAFKAQWPSATYAFMLQPHGGPSVTSWSTTYEDFRERSQYLWEALIADPTISADATILSTHHSVDTNFDYTISDPFHPVSTGYVRIGRRIADYLIDLAV